MSRHLRRFALLFSMLCSGSLLAAPSLSPAADLRAEAASAAARGEPLVILYSRADCKYCTAVRRDYLLPLQAQYKPDATDQERGPLIRQIDQDSQAPLRDFAGQPTTHAAFAAARKIRLVPVVAFYGPRGENLAESITGLRLPDFYQSYLDNALNSARGKLRR